MKKLIITSTLLITMLVMSTQYAFCQEPVKKQSTEKAEFQMGDPITRANKQTEYLAQNLALTADQKEKIYAINLEKNKLVDAAKTAAGDNKDAFIKERKRINTERDLAVNALLTPEQQAKWQKAKQEKKQNKSAKTDATVK